jgi:hypothetical protein
MTFDSQLCAGIADALGRDHALRRAYRAHLWRRVRGAGRRLPAAEVATMRADVCSLILRATLRSDRIQMTNTLLPWRM